MLFWSQFVALLMLDFDTLAYYEHLQITAVEKFIPWGQHRVVKL